MTNDRDQAYREGKRRLRDLLDKAKSEARKQETSLQSSPTSMLGQSLLETIGAKNLDSLMVYEDGPGRWYADIVLKNLPLGTPNTMGTPVDMPKPSKSEALRDAYLILVAILRSTEEQKTTARDTRPQATRIFELHGYSFKIPAEVVELSMLPRQP